MFFPVFFFEALSINLIIVRYWRKGNNTTGATGITWIIRECYEKLHADKFNK